jgi:hypothetical protein
LKQEFERIALESEGLEDLEEVGRLQARLLREFLRSLGFRKFKDRWVMAEILHNEGWWQGLAKKNGTPEGQLLFTVNDMAGNRKYSK